MENIDNIGNRKEQIITFLNSYFKDNNIKNVVIGNSGGIDSALCIALLNSCNVKVYSRFIGIETNKEDECRRANLIANAFKINHQVISGNDVEEVYEKLYDLIEDSDNIIANTTAGENYIYEDKIRRGNIKARMRMIHLYHLASFVKGLVISTDNKTERELGFWTINGDVGDVAPLYNLYKTEVYALAKFMINETHEFTGNKILSENQIDALKACIDATPTDGLGITNSDLDQLEAKSYDEVDLTLITYFNSGIVLNKKVVQRHLNSEFKRNWPAKPRGYKSWNIK